MSFPTSFSADVSRPVTPVSKQEPVRLRRIAAALKWPARSSLDGGLLANLLASGPRSCISMPCSPRSCGLSSSCSGCSMSGMAGLCRQIATWPIYSKAFATWRGLECLGCVSVESAVISATVRYTEQNSEQRVHSAGLCTLRGTNYHMGLCGVTK